MLARLDQLLSGAGVHWAWAQGSLTTLLQWGACLAFGASLPVVHAVSVALVLLECALLFLWVRREAGVHAAWAALLVHAVNGSLLVRGYGLTSAVLLPSLALGILLLGLGSPKRALIAGLLAGLGTADYEAWLLAMPVLGLWLLGRDRRHARWAFGGLGLGLALVVLPSWGILSAWWQFRAANDVAGALPNLSARAAAVFGALFLGQSHASPHLVLSGHPWLAPWTWPFLAAGAIEAWRRQRSLFLLLAGLLGPLALNSAAVETQRAVAALPVFALLAGLGWAGLRPRLQGLVQRPDLVLVLLAVLGLSMELAAYRAHRLRYDADHWGRSAAMRAFLAREGGQARLLTRLHPDSGAMRFLLRQAPVAAPDAPLLALVEPELLADLAVDPATVRNISVHPKQAHPLVLAPILAALAPRLLKLDADLAALDPPITGSRGADREHWAALRDAPLSQDPLWLALAWKRWIDSAASAGLLTRADAERAFSAPFKTGHPFVGVIYAKDYGDPWLRWWFLKAYALRHPNSVPPGVYQAQLANPPWSAPFWKPQAFAAIAVPRSQP